VRRRLALVVLAGTACFGQSLERAEALWKQRRYVEANDAFRALVKAQPKNPDHRVRWGRLYLDRSQPNDAAALFAEALELKQDHAGALLGLALVASNSFERKAVELARRALEIDPRLVEARELLARLALEDSNPAQAIEEAGRALEISPQALEAMAIRAAIDWLEDRKETPWLGRALEINPRYGRIYSTAAHFFVLNRRYEEAIELYRKAIALEPDLWKARSELGINLMRLGEEAEARQHLELCYRNGHQDDATVNTLRLMDSYQYFQIFRSENTVLKLHKSEAGLLRPFFEAEMKRAIAAFERKYRHRLTRPVQLEVYPQHEDFAVRTMGMPGLGALGVTFGYVVAMDSPSGRKPGAFHWASTLWHELSHVFVLSATRHRVPRWFTEGMAVYEETAASPDWGDRLDAEAILAIRDKKLLPIAELDRGFVRPSYPAQVTVSYFQAGRICDYIARHWSYGKLLEMMHDFAAARSTPEVVRRQLELEPGEFDRRFVAALEAETKKTVEGFDDWKKRLKVALVAARAGRHEDVIREAAVLRDRYPEYVEPGNPYELAAEAQLALKNQPAALAELERWAAIGGRSPATIKKLASLLEEAGRAKDAALALERLVFIYPLDEELHRRRGDLWLAAGDVESAIRAYQAVLAAKPLDPAASHYNLARAYRQAQRPGDARDQLLLALEAAPSFRPAQKMLLELASPKSLSAPRPGAPGAGNGGPGSRPR